jgi:drug/metabolite transporter (DMT)-like permease
MSPQMKAIPLILLGVLLNAVAQLCLKKGIHAAGDLNLQQGVVSLVMKVGLQPWVLAGLSCYVISVVVWMGALAKVDVNFAYPFIALGFLANALLAKAWLGETIPPLRWVAIAIIMAGVALQAFTGLKP